jgi:hypothetical protein
MDKWADYGISRVHYDSDPRRIVEIMRKQETETGFNPEERRSRQQVIQDIKSGISYVTLRKGPDGWWKGSLVEIVRQADGEEFIRSEGNATDRDNLGELPRY